MINLKSFFKVIVFCSFFYFISPYSATSNIPKKDTIHNGLKNALNSRDLDLIKQYFENPDKEKITNKFTKIIKDFPDSKWEIKNINRESSNFNIVAIIIKGSNNIDGREFKLESKFNFLFSLKNGKIKQGKIKDNLTIIRTDKNKIDLDFLIPNKVLTGSKYDIDIIVNDPLEDEIIAGGITAHQEDTIIEQPIPIRPLISGGIYKVTRAPTKPGIQIWSGIIAHPKGLVSFTKTVDIVEKF